MEVVEASFCDRPDLPGAAAARLQCAHDCSGRRRRRLRPTPSPPRLKLIKPPPTREPQGGRRATRGVRRGDRPIHSGRARAPLGVTSDPPRAAFNRRVSDRPPARRRRYLGASYLMKTRVHVVFLQPPADVQPVLEDEMEPRGPR